MLNNLVKLDLIFIAVFLSACAQLPTNFEAKDSFVITDTQNTTLGKRSLKYLKDVNESKLYLLSDGIDAFVARASMLHLAEKTIDVQYYIWHSDLSGKILFNGLLLAADKGVRVRILLDDMPVKPATEKILYALDQHKNIEVRLYNPFSVRGFRVADYLMNPLRINHRMHNKSFTVDNQYTITGGRNIGNEYFHADERSNFKDIDVLATGALVIEVENQFDLYWNSEVVYPVTAFDHNKATEKDLIKTRRELNDFSESHRDSQYHLDVQGSAMYKSIIRGDLTKVEKNLLFKGESHLIYDDPEKGLGKTSEEVVFLKSLLMPYLEKVDKSFEIISPYFVPGADGVEYLTGLVKKGIKVRVITNSLSSTDGMLAQSGYSRRRYDLLEAGVELYELKANTKTHVSKSLRRGDKAKSALHAKTFVFDREQVFIGSLNFDKRSININSEVGVVYDVEDMAKLIAVNVFDKGLKNNTYQVRISDHIMEIDGVEIDKGEYYWTERQEGKEVYYAAEPETGFWRRFGQGFFSIMPIESQL